MMTHNGESHPAFLCDEPLIPPLRAISVHSRALTHRSGLHLPRSLHGIPVLSRLKRGSLFSINLWGWQRGQTRLQRPRFGLNSRMYVPHFGQNGLWLPGAMVNGGILSLGRRPRGLGNASGGCAPTRGRRGGLGSSAAWARGCSVESVVKCCGDAPVWAGRAGTAGSVRKSEPFASELGGGRPESPAGLTKDGSPGGMIPGKGFFLGRPRGRLTGAVPSRASAFRIMASIWSIADGRTGGAVSSAVECKTLGAGEGGTAGGIDGGRAGSLGTVPGKGYFLGRPRGRFLGCWGGNNAGSAGDTASGLTTTESFFRTARGLRLPGVPSLSCVFLGLGIDTLFRETVVGPF